MNQPIVLFFKAYQPDLFDAIVPVKGFTRKDGATVKPHMAKRSKKTSNKDLTHRPGGPTVLFRGKGKAPAQSTGEEPMNLELTSKSGRPLAFTQSSGGPVTVLVGEDKFSLVEGRAFKITQGSGLGAQYLGDFGLRITHESKPDGTIVIDAASAEKFGAWRKQWLAEEGRREEKRLNDAAPGLSELREALQAREEYFESTSRAMEDEGNDGVNMPSAPKADFDELQKKYPRAAAYLTAESYERASNVDKSIAGTKAMKILLEGGSIEDAQKVLDNWLPKHAAWN